MRIYESCAVLIGETSGFFKLLGLQSNSFFGSFVYSVPLRLKEFWVPPCLRASVVDFIYPVFGIYGPYKAHAQACGHRIDQRQ